MKDDYRTLSKERKILAFQGRLRPSRPSAPRLKQSSVVKLDLMAALVHVLSDVT